MGIVLTKEPPGEEGTLRVVDGGVAFRHSPWLSECHAMVAFTLDELTPLPAGLTCPACGEHSPVEGWFRAELERGLALLSVPIGGTDE